MRYTQSVHLLILSLTHSESPLYSKCMVTITFCCFYIYAQYIQQFFHLSNSNPQGFSPRSGKERNHRNYPLSFLIIIPLVVGLGQLNLPKINLQSHSRSHLKPSKDKMAHSSCGNVDGCIDDGKTSFCPKDAKDAKNSCKGCFLVRVSHLHLSLIADYSYS